MKKIGNREHDFGAKLRQTSIIERLKEYVTRQRKLYQTGVAEDLPDYGPLSINLDLTAACNFACPHCVDSTIINSGEMLHTEKIKKSIQNLKSRGLLSVIILGGGEPTLHRDFQEIIEYLKNQKLQVGIVTNGTKLGRVKGVVHLLEKKDWIRLSIDAARENTFINSHRPRSNISLQKILSDAREIKQSNPDIDMGYSFVIVWDGIEINGQELCPNIMEIPEAVELAKEYLFDYVSFKPCLIRLEGSQKESLFAKPDPEKEKQVIRMIKRRLAEAKERTGDSLKILESVNLTAMLDNTIHELKIQPRTCHMQFFRTVLTPTGIFHCPAFRGVKKAQISGPDGYRSEGDFTKTQVNLAQSVEHFNATDECSVVACFYHHVNWWIENFIQSNRPVEELESITDDNFFL